MKYLDELNEVQRLAVQRIKGPQLIIAGPGSGKTRVLTYRIAHMIEQGIDPFRILTLTFTNKAAKEMKTRIESLIGNEARNVFMGTFHSVFARLLRFDGEKLGYPSNFTIYDTDDSKNLIKILVKERGLNDKLYKPNIVLNAISNAKNSLITPHAYLEDPERMAHDAASGRPKIGDIYRAYANRCFQSGAMDFDDLLFKMYELLVRFPEMLHKYQNKFHYIMIDEYQDTNYSQYMIVKKMAAANENICVVGDDAQSIYSFRGATIRNILSFERDYPDLEVSKLEQNYRSTSNIVKAANALITQNDRQLAKTIWTENKEGAKIKVVKAVSDSEEGKMVADSIVENKLRFHKTNKDFAVLYRTNAQSRSFEEALRRKNVPYIVYGGISFYQRKEVKDVLAYLKLTINHFDEEALRRTINYPARGIGKTTLEKITVQANNHNARIWDVIENIEQQQLSSRAKQNLIQFRNMIKSFAAQLEKLNAWELANHVATSTGLLRELYNDKTVEGIARYENMQELLNGIKEFTEEDVVENEADEYLRRDRSLSTYLQDIALLTSADNDKEKIDTVKLMTVHAAKGLEFSDVYVVGMEENLFPSGMNVHDRDDLEEERRLFYVAITRAESRLWLSFAKTRYRFGSLIYCEPSRFLEEIPQELIDFKGDSFRRPSFAPPKDPWSKEKNYTDIKSDLNRKLTVIKSRSPQEEDQSFEPDDAKLIRSGMRVLHQKFGKGEVTDLSGKEPNKIATIYFKQVGAKKIMLKFARLKIVDK